RRGSTTSGSGGPARGRGDFAARRAGGGRHRRAARALERRTAMTTGLPAGRRFTVSVLVLLAAGIGIAYGGGFGIGFYFDDAYGIEENPAIRSLRNVPRFFADATAYWTADEDVDLPP